MGITHATVVQLATEGIMSVIDLADFDIESLQQLADNLRRPGRVSDPKPAAGHDGNKVGLGLLVKGMTSRLLLPISFSRILWLRRG
jgi:hypothetical protein